MVEKLPYDIVERDLQPVALISTGYMPRPILDRLNAAVNRTIVEPTAKERLEQLGSEGDGGTPEQFAALIRKDSAKWAGVIKRSGAKID